MPIDLGQLACIQTLAFFVVGQETGCRIEELGCLNKLRGDQQFTILSGVHNMEEAKRENMLDKI